MTHFDRFRIPVADAISKSPHSRRMLWAGTGAALLVAATLAVAALPAGGQVDTSKPIRIKTLKPKRVTFEGEVMHANPIAITVRSQENELLIRTFGYSPKVREEMQKIIDRDRKSTRLNSSHLGISYAVFCLKKKKQKHKK